MGTMTTTHQADDIDARLLLALTAAPRATTIALAEQAKLSRNTVQARLAKLEESGALQSFERRIDPDDLPFVENGLPAGYMPPTVPKITPVE